MKEIIIAYPVKDVALQLRSMIENEGYHVSYICACGATVLNIAQRMNEGVIVCASILSDMGAGVLAENLPVGFDVVALSKNGVESYMGNLISLPLPVNRSEFLNTIAILVSSRSGFTRRKDNENEIISDAKTILMNNNDITEMQAHKYLQKESMKSGKKMVELAKEIINDFRQ
ncbi:MAG: ANTAR domain-containing protein [Acetobacter sp.]|nr:ANTAR domain-containing protein [Bacteroides sp.]MCM1340969.1 ANTAR domain-containing protein [Acetobacter sp.]MCM1432475.1 ANTAR domain-containing protein [Clostridiales bacterium]